MNSIFNLDVLAGVLRTMITMATPFLFASLGETFSQLSGVINLGVDGIMLLSAFFAFYITYITGNLWLGLFVAMITGLAMGLLMSLVSVTFKAQQGISGIGLQMFGLGMSSLLFKMLVGTVKTVSGFQPIKIPLLGDIPFIGEIFFHHNILVYISFLLVPLAWWVIERTTLGLKIKAAGQNPAAVDSVGISVDKIRYISVCIGSVLAGMAGASLSISISNLFQDNLTAGQGFIAVALVYFGGWTPVGVLGGALLFSLANSTQLWLQVLGVDIPASLAVMFPYILTIVVLTGAVNRGKQPAALNKRFFRGEA
jgi:general nucleoside transport system permease protein